MIQKKTQNIFYLFVEAVGSSYIDSFHFVCNLISSYIFSRIGEALSFFFFFVSNSFSFSNVIKIVINNKLRSALRPMHNTRGFNGFVIKMDASVTNL